MMRLGLSAVRRPNVWARRSLIGGMVKYVPLLALLPVLHASAPAFAHDSGMGWQYPADCCHDRDCKPVTCDSISETRDGFLQGGLTYRRDQVRATQDSKCHACAMSGRPICLFILPST